MWRLSLNRSEPAKKSGQNIPKNRCRTTTPERVVETLAELPFIGDQVGLLKPRPGRPQSLGKRCRSNCYMSKPFDGESLRKCIRSAVHYDGGASNI
jgi:hypothetical protein